MRYKWFNTSFYTFFMLAIISVLPGNVCAQEMAQSFEWSISANKNTFYPGEPVLLILSIENKGNQKDEIDFGMDGIEAFSMKICDPNNNIMSEGKKIQRFGVSRMPYLVIIPGKTSQKSAVLNQWCSTLLPPGEYHIICDVEYRIRSEEQKQPETIVMKAGPLHKIQLELDIQIIEMDEAKFTELIKDLFSTEVQTESQSKRVWLDNREIAREMLALTESDLAVPYQLQILKAEQDTWRKRDIINSLVHSGTLDAARGLAQIIEDTSIYKEDVKSYLVNSVYKLRETGKAEILDATNEFVKKYKRPVIGAAGD